MCLSKSICLLFLPFFSSFSYSQNLKKESGDMSHAISLEVNKTYTFPLSPVGFGNVQEFPRNINRKPNVFKEERNTVWFLLPIPYSGRLEFEISPKDIKDDYDWIAYQYHNNLAKEIADESAHPLRSNISRNDELAESKTGLRKGYENYFANPGPGKSFSKLLDVKKGDTIALIIDNIYDGGKGFSFSSRLDIDVSLNALLKGRLFNSKKLPLNGELLCEDDSTGLVLSAVKVSANSPYSIPVPLDRPVNLVAKANGYIYKTADLIVSKPQDTLNFYLDPVASGNKLILFNVHFAPDKDLILYNATAELTRLINFLKENAQYNVRIVGHTNNNPFANTKYLQRLSFDRALAVKKYLLTHGIPEERLSCAGMGGKSPFVNTKDPVEGLKNLRVEVVLVKR